MIRGRVIDGTARAGISGALVELRDSSGVIVQRTFSGATGGFAFAPSHAGRYQVHVAAIGYGRHPAVDADVAATLVVLPDIVLSAVVISLPTIEALSGKRSCGRSQLTAETFGGLLDAARTSLEVIDGTVRSGTVAFQMRLIHAMTLYNNRKDKFSADTADRVITAWPVRSLAPDSLQAIGFMREKTPEEGGGQVFYGVDFAALFSDWFLDTHCFTLDKGQSRGDTLVIAFAPQGKPKHVDLRGDLYLDRASLTLRRLTYEHRNLPAGFPDKSAGGSMDFAELMPGLWVPMDWSIWAPIVKVSRMIYRPVLGPPMPVGRGMSRPPPQVMSATVRQIVDVVGREENRGQLLRIAPAGH
ncbi:MAG: carboxypeptidase-like regulatory domain-containing protein [Gemmatimonadales bacterium]